MNSTRDVAVRVAVLIAIACSSGLRAQVDLLPDRVYPTNGSPTSIVTLHLDGDALPDLVVGEQAGITRMLGKPGGKLVVLPPIALTSVQTMIVADMQGDGKDDVVALEPNSGVVTVLLSDGTGALTISGTASTGGGGSRGLAAGDFNGDGRLDIVTANELGNNVGVLFGIGHGQLANAVTFPVANVAPIPAQPRGVAVGDFNEDGKLDIVSANSAYPSSLSVLLGDGTGHFAPSVNFQAGATSGWGGEKVAVADLNHDGHLDLTTDSGVRLGDGTGAFPTLLPIWFGVKQLVDFNQDGNIDAVSGGGLLRVTLGDGLGGILSKTDYPCGNYAIDAAVADFDGDGDLDVAALNGDDGGQSEWGDVHLMLNDGTGALPQPSYQTLPSQTPASERLAIADLDNDGARDLVALGFFDLSVLRGDGAGGFLPPTQFPLDTTQALDLSVADIDGDGDEDAAVLLQSSPTDCAILLGDGAGGFSAPSMLSLEANTTALTLGDLDHDGLADLVTVSWQPDAITVRHGIGGGSFGPPVTRLLFFPCCDGYGSQVQLIDLDADGKLDALIARFGGAFAVCHGNGAGGFGATTMHPGLGKQLVAADLDGDGDLDIVGEDAQRNVGVMLAVPGGYATPVTFAPFEGVPAVGDLDADGDLDIVALDLATSDATCLLNDGAGHFTVHGTFLAGGKPVQGFIEDLDGNGFGDVVALCTHSQWLFTEHVTVLHNQSQSPWLGVGHALAGTQGAPLLTGFGTLQPNSPITLKIAQGKPLGSATLVIGPAAIDAPFKGGVLVPYPAVLLFGLPLDGKGAFSGTGTWYSGLPSGSTVHFQAWIADPAGPAGYAATNGLRGTTP